MGEKIPPRSTPESDKWSEQAAPEPKEQREINVTVDALAKIQLKEMREKGHDDALIRAVNKEIERLLEEEGADDDEKKENAILRMLAKGK